MNGFGGNKRTKGYDLQGYYEGLVGRYVRTLGPHITGVGKVVQVDEGTMLLSPAVTNIGTRKRNKLCINFGYPNRVAMSGVNVEVLTSDDEKGMAYLEELVRDFNEMADREFFKQEVEAPKLKGIVLATR